MKKIGAVRYYGPLEYAPDTQLREPLSDDLCYWSATKVAAAIRERRLSPLEVFEVAATRIEAINPKINGYVTLTLDQARDAARRAQEVLVAPGAGELIPLHGVPVVVKDDLAVHCFRFTCGSSLLAGHSADLDDVTVQRLRRGGAILLGKTNLTEFGHKGTTHNLLFGVTNNPWDLRRRLRRLRRRLGGGRGRRARLPGIRHAARPVRGISIRRSALPPRRNEWPAKPPGGRCFFFRFLRLRSRGHPLLLPRNAKPAKPPPPRSLWGIAGNPPGLAGLVGRPIVGTASCLGVRRFRRFRRYRVRRDTERSRGSAARPWPCWDVRSSRRGRPPPARLATAGRRRWSGTCAGYVGGQQRGRIAVPADALLGAVTDPPAGGATVAGVSPAQGAGPLLELEVRCNEALLEVRGGPGEGADIAVGLDDFQDALEGVLPGE